MSPKSDRGDHIRVVLYYDNTRKRIEDTIPRDPPYPTYISHRGRFFKIYHPLGYFSKAVNSVYYDEISIFPFAHLKHGIRTKRR